jgi:uncharacterized protein
MNSNLAIVNELYTAFARRDIKGMLVLLSDDIEWGEPENPHNPAGGIRKGHDGFLEWISIGRDAEEILVLEPDRFLTDEYGVAVTGYMKCRAIATGKLYESDFVHLVTIKNGKICRFIEFFDTYIAGEAFKG